MYAVDKTTQKSASKKLKSSAVLRESLAFISRAKQESRFNCIKTTEVILYFITKVIPYTCLCIVAPYCGNYITFAKKIWHNYSLNNYENLPNIRLYTIRSSLNSENIWRFWSSYFWRILSHRKMGHFCIMSHNATLFFANNTLMPTLSVMSIISMKSTSLTRYVQHSPWRRYVLPKCSFYLFCLWNGKTASG